MTHIYFARRNFTSSFMRLRLRTAVVALFASSVLAQGQTNTPIPLWAEGAPGALGKEDKDMPTITPFLPTDSASGAAMVILPGGGYGGLAPHEGKGYADWLVTNGIACFVVKYRLGSQGYRHPRMLEDAARAVRLVRARADGWRIDPKRVGIMGSSAGGHLASTLLTHFEIGRASCRERV